MSEEDPGKIVLDVSTGLVLGGKSAYYGSVDATPLFVSVLGGVSRWGFAKTPSPRCCTGPCPGLDPGLRNKDGDGFIEYQRLNDQA